MCVTVVITAHPNSATAFCVCFKYGMSIDVSHTIFCLFTKRGSELPPASGVRQEPWHKTFRITEAARSSHNSSSRFSIVASELLRTALPYVSIRLPSGSTNALSSVGSQFSNAASISLSWCRVVAVNAKIALPSTSSRKPNVAIVRPRVSQNIGLCRCVGNKEGRFFKSTTNLLCSVASSGFDGWRWSPSQSCFLGIRFHFLVSNLYKTVCHGALIGV
jgi:hypothetical protein